MYRDSREYRSLQVREYETYYLVQLDHANPTVGSIDTIVAHYKLDVAPDQKLVLGIGTLGLAYLVLRAFERVATQ